jgi:diamine N-acetyltransferase
MSGEANGRRAGALSYVPGEGSPEGFYRGLGFEPTGEVLEGEVVMSLRVNDRSGRTAE